MFVGQKKTSLQENVGSDCLSCCSQAKLRWRIYLTSVFFLVKLFDHTISDVQTSISFFCVSTLNVAAILF